MYPYMPKPQEEKDVDVPVNLIKDLLTESEWRMVKQRLFVIQLLARGLSIRQVATRAKVGTDTVVRISRMLAGSPKLKEWLEDKNPTSSSKWVFGQVRLKEDF
jgi:Trp operon repressor